MPDTNDDVNVSGGPSSNSSTKTAAAAAGVAPASDLSAQIVGTVERQRGDVVRCTHVGGDRYRCNWWAPAVAAGYSDPVMPGLLVTTHRVRQSQFLRVTRTSAGQLNISVQGASSN